ncbi:MFS transporter [Cellulomonas sp. Root137]|uniref:MFS transporter n=1 Tax=Cellulomonas sp. Root137 TaxID=1736459 RepID=UPI000A8AAE4D|nr:MFS transporter [Cellulomonas sp. Root137]
MRPPTSLPLLQDAPEQKRVLSILVLAQVLSGAGLAAGITVGALLAQDMLGTTSLSGLPSALFTLGSAGAALAVGALSQRSGRRVGLATGYALGAIGSVGVVIAAVSDNVPLLLLALLVYGAGTATNLQARYAGADLAAPSRRGRAVSTVLVATTLGAVVGPNLVTIMGDLSMTWGIPMLAGPFILAAVAYGAASIVLGLLLRPDPLLLARRRATGTSEHVSFPDVPVTSPTRFSRDVAFGASVMVISQLVMVAIMTMTPIHMAHHGHSLAAAGMVIAVHIGSMYLPSPLSGWLVDRLGSTVVAGLAAATLMSAGLLAASVPASSVAGLAVALGLLGLGWSFGLVAGTAIITGAVPLATRARTQGRVDVLIALAGATGGAVSGLVVAGASYTALALGGGLIALALVPLVAVERARHVVLSRPGVLAGR